ncbi:serine/threonine-protein kinase [Occultella kanbiaonis]|uniref:serine/threonine-protein kinase n=1 Tax=Occultella kanbiaonis TaxID=2675754 RepID=UPI001A9984D0|nr:serine/threonine-protein kinase [Occultella kanbiaonis]
MDFEPGQVFAGYTIERELGRGGMGSVYLAKHPRLPRRDALKMLSTSLSSDESFRTRFEREADLAAQLFHRNIVAVYDRGEFEGQLWIAMQYVEGTDASHAIAAAGGGLDPARVVHIVTEVGNGLDFAHRAGLLHRDVKPANILLAPGLDPDDPEEPEQVLLTDFGIAKAIDDRDNNLTGTGNMLATLAYAAPEQIEARPLGHEVDVYALGCVLYELLTGSVPFVADSPFAKMTAHLTQDPPKPSEAQPGLGTSFDAVVAKAMAKKPEDRYQSCRALSRAAAAALKTLTEQSETATVLQPARTPAAAPGEQPGSPHPTPTPSRAHTGPRPPFTLKVRRYFADGRQSQEVGPVDTRNVPMADRTALEALLHEARFFDLPPRLPLERQITGDYLEEITVGAGERTWTVAYEHQGSRHPLVLDQIAPRLARIAPWHVTSAAPAAYLRANNAPGNRSWSPNATIGPIGQGGRDTGPHATRQVPPVPMPTGPIPASPMQTGSMPTGPIPTGAAPTGAAPTRSTGGMPSYLSAPAMPTAQHSGIHAVGHKAPVRRGPNPAMITGFAVALVAIIVLIVIAANGGFGGANDDPDGIEAPAELTITVNGDGETVVNWSSVPDATGYELDRDGDLVYEGTARQFVDTAPSGQEYTVRAIGPDGETSDDSTPAVAEASLDPGSWGDAEFMRTAFPSLVPDGPNLPGHNDATCALGSSEQLPQPDTVDAAITCTQSDGLVFTLLHFTSADALATFGSDGVANEGWFSQEWFYDSAPDDPAGTEYGSQDGVTDPGFIYTTFVHPDRAQYMVAVWWPDHERLDIRRDWWVGAPF